MKILVPLLLTVTAFAAEKTFDRTLTTGANPALSVNTNSGNIHLHAGSDTQMHIYARLKANEGWSFFGGSSTSDLQERMNRIAANPPIEQAGAAITIGRHENESLYKNISIDYDIALPRGTALTANTASGNIDVEEAGTSLKASTASGSITARGTHGPANLDAASGDIRLESGDPRAEVRAQTGSGNISVKGAGGAVRAGTGSGNIDIENSSPGADWKLETGSGNVTLRLVSGARFTLDAETGSGSVHTDQPMQVQGSLDNHHVRGAVNGGGAMVHAETGSGDISVR